MSNFASERVVIVVLLVLLGGCRTTSETSVAVRADPVLPQNIILFVSDGCGPASFTMTRQFLAEQRQIGGLALDSILVGHVATRAANALITDSASSATAYACGIRTNNGMIGMAPDGSSRESLVEVAEAAGMSTGLVVTTRLTHATPASFSAHVPDRGMEAEIASQQVTSGVDLMIGGGRRFFLPESAGGSRDDGRDLLAEAADRGYRVVNDWLGVDTLSSLPVLAFLAADHMPYEVDRPDSIPSLAAMTQRGIDLLSDDEDGFFLLVEGSRIDHAAHSNDAAGHVHDIIAYDAAVSVALRYARANENTLVVSVSDHETGGLTIGRSVDGRSKYEWHPDVLDQISASHDVILGAIRNDGRPAREVLESYTGITDFTDEEVGSLASGSWGAANAALGEMISRRTLIGWTTGGHTAVDVNLFAFGPGSERMKGHVENAELGSKLIALVKGRKTGI